MIKTATARSELPIGGLPWVTLLLVLAAVALSLAPPSDLRPSAGGDADAFETASRYWRSHPYLAVSPRFVDRALASQSDVNPLLAREALYAMSKRSRPANAAQQEAEQARMDALIARIRVEGAPEPDAEAGPTAMSWRLEGVTAGTATALVDQLVHPLPLTLLSSIALLLLFGAAAEMRWGHLAVALLFAAAAGLAASGRWLSGASAAPIGDGALATTSALALALLLGTGSGTLGFHVFRISNRRLEDLRIASPHWLGAALWLTLSVPAVMAGVSAGIGSPILSLSAGGALGLAVALGVRNTGGRQREAAEPLEDAARAARTAADEVAPTLAAKPEATPAADPPEPGVEDWIERLRSDPTDASAARVLEQSAIAARRLADAAPALRGHLLEQLRSGETEPAARLWQRMRDNGVLLDLDSEACLRLAPALAGCGDEEGAFEVLRQSLAPPAGELGASVVLRILEVSEQLGAPTRLPAARRALAYPDLHPTKRERIEAIINGGAQTASPSRAAPESPAPTAPPPEKPRPDAKVRPPAETPIQPARRPPAPSAPPPAPEQSGQNLFADAPIDLGADRTEDRPVPRVTPQPAGAKPLGDGRSERGKDLEPWSPDGQLEIPASWDDEPPEYLGSTPLAQPLDPQGGLDLSPDLVTPNPDATIQAVGGAAPPPVPARPPREPASPAAAPAERSATPAAGDARDDDSLAALPRFDSITIVDAAPIALEPEVLYFRLSSGRRAKVSWSEIEAIAVAAVRDLSRKPVVVVDLLLNWQSDGESALRSIRLRSDRFNPGQLTGEASSPTESLRGFLRELALRSDAQPLPDHDASRGRPFRAFRLLRDYQRLVLKVDC